MCDFTARRALHLLLDELVNPGSHPLVKKKGRLVALKIYSTDVNVRKWRNLPSRSISRSTSNVKENFRSLCHVHRKDRRKNATIHGRDSMGMSSTSMLQ